LADCVPPEILAPSGRGKVQIHEIRFSNHRFAVNVHRL
jgi:hypothetical protein